MRLLLSYIFSLFLILPVFSQQNLQKVRINRFERGQNSSDLADIIDLNQGVSLKNVVINKRGELSKRKGQALFVASNGTAAFTGLGRFDPDTSTSIMLVASDTSVIRATISDNSWTVINSANPLTTGKDTEFVQANNLVFILNGQDRTSWYDGVTYTPGTDSTASPPVATTAEWLRNYMFYGGNPTNTDWIFFSNNLSPEVMTPTDIIKVNTGDGQPIKALKAFRLNELIVYKERSIFVLDITGTTPLDDWTVQPISKVVGCIAPRSVVQLGNDQWFLSSEPIAVRSLVRSSFDKILVNMVSEPIQDYLDGTGDTTLNVNQIEKACAVLFDEKYILALPTGTSTVNNTVLVYDFRAGGWYVIDGWFPAAWVVFNNDLYYIDANTGRVLQCFTGNTGDFIEANATSTPTAAIVFEYVTKQIDFDNPENFKRLDSIEYEFDTAGDYDAKLFINIDEEGFNEVASVNLSGGVVTLPETLPFTLAAGGFVTETEQLTQYGEFRKLQIKITQGSDTGETCNLRRITVFGRIKPWRRQ